MSAPPLPAPPAAPPAPPPPPAPAVPSLTPQALGLGASPTAPRPAPQATPPPPRGQAVALPTSPADREGMYRGLLWVAWAVEECSRAYTRLSSRALRLESRLDLLEAEAGPGTARPPVPPAAGLDKQAKDRLDAVERRIRHLEHLPAKVANLQRALDQWEPVVPPAPAAPAPEAAEAGGADLEAVYQELDRMAEFVASRVTRLERAVDELRGDDRDRRLAELETRLQRYERMFTAMQAGLQVAAR